MGQNRPLFPMLNSRLCTVGYANKAKHGCVDWQLSDSMKIFTRIKDNCRMLLNPRAKREETEKRNRVASKQGDSKYERRFFFNSRRKSRRDRLIGEKKREIFQANN